MRVELAERVLFLTDHLCDRLAGVGLQVYSSRRQAEKSAIVSVLVPGANPQEIKKRCRDQGVVINHRAGRLRVSPHAYNTVEELDRLIDLLR